MSQFLLSLYAQHLLLLLFLVLLLQSLLLIMLLVHFFNLVSLLLVGVPLASLQDQNTNKQKSQDGIAGSQDLERIFSSKVFARIIDLTCSKSRVAIDTRSDDAHALDDVGNVDSDTTHVKYKTSAVEEEVGFRRSVELGDEAQETGTNDNVEDTRDQRWGRVDELEVVLEHLVVGPTRVHTGYDRRRSGPKDVVVVRERCEEDSQEEASRCIVVSVAIVSR